MEAFSSPNEYIYTNLKDCRMTYEVLSCAIHSYAGSCFPYIGAWRGYASCLVLGDRQKPCFSLPASFAEGDVLKLEAFDRDGHRICDRASSLSGLQIRIFSVIWHRFPRACPVILFRHVTTQNKLY